VIFILPNLYLTELIYFITTGGNYLIPVYYADRLQSLVPALINVIVHWFFDSPVEQLERLISVYKKTIVMLLDANQPKGQVRPNSPLTK